MSLIAPDSVAASLWDARALRAAKRLQHSAELAP